MTTMTDTNRRQRQGASHVCPWWVGYLLASPLRRFFENPAALVGPYVRPGDTVVDLGSAMGYFSFPLAKMVGAEGRVVCVDVQARMLSTLQSKIHRKQLEGVMETRLCDSRNLGLDDLVGMADLAVAWHVVHEVEDRAGFLQQCHGTLRPGGRLLLAEPVGHVQQEDIDSELSLARDAGFREVESHRNRRSQIAVLLK